MSERTTISFTAGGHWQDPAAFHYSKAITGSGTVGNDQTLDTFLAAQEVDEDVDGCYTKEPNRARTSFLSPRLTMAGRHDGFGVRDLGGSGCQLLYCLHT